MSFPAPGQMQGHEVVCTIEQLGNETNYNLEVTETVNQQASERLLQERC